MSKNISIDQLTDLFVGKKITILNQSAHAKKTSAGYTVRGICKKIHPTETGMEFEMEDRIRFSIVPENLTEDSVEGCASLGSFLKRKIQLAA